MGILKHSGGGSSDSPKKENTETLNTTESTEATEATNSESLSVKKKIDIPWGNLMISLFAPGLLYLILFFVLSNADVNFLLSNLIGCILAIMLLAYIQSVFKSGSELATPIQIILAFILILSLSIHYLPDYGKDNSKNNSKTELSSETGTLRSVGEVWFTDNIFKAGSTVEIKVSYQSIQMVGGKLYTPGVYKYIPPGDGKIIFKGIIDAPSNVKVSY